MCVCFFSFAFGETERFSGALRQQLVGHVHLRSRHEGLRVPSDSTAAVPPPPHPLPNPTSLTTSPTPTGDRGEVLTRRGGWSSASNNGLQSQHISASAVDRHVACTVLTTHPPSILSDARCTPPYTHTHTRVRTQAQRWSLFSRRFTISYSHWSGRDFHWVCNSQSASRELMCALDDGGTII